MPGAAPREVKFFDGPLPPSCDSSELRVTTVSGTSTFPVGGDQLIWPTSWDSFTVIKYNAPLSANVLIAGWGRGSERFEDREVRELEHTVVLLPGQTPSLACAGGEKRVIATETRGYVQLSGLTGLPCGEAVSGSLTYCSSEHCNDPTYDSYMLHGTLDGDMKRFVTGDKSFEEPLLALTLGHSVLVGRTSRTAGGELQLEEGAFLDNVTGKLYCVGSLSGSLDEGAVGQVTFSDFRRALPCPETTAGPKIEGCAPLAQAPEED
jgi:hypothetical protein